MKWIVAAARLSIPALSILPEATRKKHLRRIARRITRMAPDEYEAYRFDGGRIYLNLSESKMMVMRALGLYENGKRLLLHRMLKPGMTFIDVGANKGDFSLLASRLVGPSGKVFAIEPEPSNCEWLRKSIELNGYRNIALRQLALSDHDGEATLHLGDKSGYHTLRGDGLKHAAGAVRVRIEKLDSMLEEAGSPKVDLIKIDVEGSELEVLRGAAKTLAANPDAIVLADLHPHLGADIASVEEFLADRDYRFFLIDSVSQPIAHLPRVAADIAASHSALDPR